MGYFNESPDPRLSGCGPNCSCTACRQKYSGLAEYYFEDEGRDRGRLNGFGGVFAEGPSPGAFTRDVKIVVKSYIAPIGPSAGSPYCGGLLDPTAHLRLRAFAAATDLGFSENPLTDAKDKRYRLYSSRTFTVTCTNGRIVSVVPSPIDTDAGKECIPRTSACLQPPPLIVSGVSGSISGANRFEFTWTVKGRPHNAVEPGFQAICGRTSVYIWHRIRGSIECGPGEVGTIINLEGSGFPSHRAFVNGAIRTTRPQGPFSNLWVSASRSDPTLVR